MKPTDSNMTLRTAAADAGEADGAGLSASAVAVVGDSSSSDALERARRDSELRRVMADVMSRRARGEVLSDDRILAEHPDLQPQLTEELEGLRMLRRAFLAAQKAGPIDRPLDPIDPEKIESPIAAPDDAAGAGGDADALEIPPLVIQGYQILSEISRGGQATVYKAVQEVTGRRVAIKILPGGPLAGARHRARFEREAQALAALDHPNVVGILDRGRSADGSFFLVMQFVDGCALDEYAAEAQLAEADFPVGLLRKFVKIADAVQEAHRLGIVHRDLKPSNIRVDSRGEPHLLDFGLARILDHDRPGPESATVLTMAGQVVGSLPWTSPEQAGGGSAQVDARSDVYALGVCLYQCLTGRFPYPVAGSITEIVRHITMTPPAPLRWTSVRFTRVGALEAILAKALAKAPARRYATAAELARDLESLLEGRAVTAGEGFFLPLQRWIRPAVWVAVACLVVAGVWLARSQPWRSNIPTRHRAGLPTMQNSIGMKMMLVPPGWFMMGSASRYPSPLWADDEHIHEVRLTQPFWVSDCEVTVEQYEQVMGTLAEGMAGADRHLPVTHVTWDEANAFCEELSKREGRKYRLPTEAQWEYACRAGSMEPFAGNGDANSMGWTKVTPGGGGRLHTGGLRGDNDWGLHDFHGNAAEWCLDVYVKDYLEFSQNPVLTGSAGPHVIRGGSYLKNPLDCRSSARDQALPNARREDLGFRVVQVKDETK